jgi:hypothetical protein
MPYRLSHAVLAPALAGLCLALPACISDLPTQSTLQVLVHDEQLAELIPVLEENGATVKPLGDDTWEIRNDADSRQAVEELLTTIDATIETHRSRLVGAYEQLRLPGRNSRYASRCVHALAEAHEKRHRVASILEQMDPARIAGQGRTPRATNPDGSWRPTAAFYDARLPLARAASTDELIEQASRGPLPTDSGQRLVSKPAGPPVASR